MDLRPEQFQSTGTDKYQIQQSGPQVECAPLVEVFEEPGESVEEND